MIQLRHLKMHNVVEAYFCDADELEWRRVRVVEIYRFTKPIRVAVRLPGANPGGRTFVRRLKHLRKVR